MDNEQEILAQISRKQAEVKARQKSPESMSRITAQVASKFTVSKEQIRKSEQRIAQYNREQKRLSLAERRNNVAASLRRFIPPRYTEARLRDFEEDFILDIVRADYTNGIIFTGPTGPGKTHAMCALARWLIRRGKKCQREKWTKLFIEVRGTYSKDAANTEENIVNRMIGPECLFIEDIGADKDLNEKESGYAKRILYAVLDDRIELCRPTFISTNLNKINFAGKFDVRIADRLNLFTWLAVEGPSKRRANE